MTGIAVFYVVVVIASVVGLMIYLKTLKWVGEYVEKVPDVSIFVLFLIYGLTFFLLITTALFGWSGMSSVLMLFLVFAAPFIMIIIAIDSFVRRKKSIIHRYMFYISIAYPIGLLLLMVLMSDAVRLL